MLNNITILLPEIFLAGSILFALLVGAFSSVENQFKNTHTISLATLFSLTGLYYVFTGAEGLDVFSVTGLQTFADGMFFTYNYINIAKILILICSIVLLINAKPYLETRQSLKFEYNILFLTAILGSFVAISTNNFMVMFIGLELLSFSLYILVGFVTNALKPIKSANKYFIVGSIASALMLYGISLIYATLGSLSYSSLALYINTIGFETMPFQIFLGLVLILCAILFKLAIVPLHFYLSDVLEGSNRPILGFISTVSKVVGLMVLFQILIMVLPAPSIVPDAYFNTLIFLAVASVFIGSVYAIKENNINRILAYSSINNAGFMLICAMFLSFPNMLFYLVSYSLITLALVSFLLSFKVKGEYIKTLQDLAYITKSNHKFALIGVFLIFALSGIPPFILFYAKFVVIKSLVDYGFIISATLLVIGSVVSAAYCLRLVKYIYMSEKIADVSVQKIKLSKLITYILFILVLVFSSNPDLVFLIF